MLPAVEPIPPAGTVEARCRRLARGLGLTASVIGLGVLAGWTFHLPSLMTVLPGLVAMKPNAAICLGLGGMSLFLLADPTPRPRNRQVSALLALVMAAVGALTLVEYLGGYNFGMDEFLFKDRYVSGAPGRMAPISAMNSVGIGLALLLSRSPRRVVLAHALAVGVVFTSVFSIAGYLYGVDSLYRTGRFTAVALHTSVTFLLLGVGIWCTGSQAGFMRVATGPATSGVLVRRYVPAALVIPFLIGWLRVMGVRYGWFGPELGVVLVAMANATTFVLLVWIGARSLRVAEGRQSRAQEALRESEARFQELANAMPQIVWAAREDRQLDYYNARWYDYTGRPQGEFGDGSWQHILPPDDLTRVAQVWTDAAAAGRPYEVEFRLRGGSDGTYRWFLGRTVPIKDADGKVLRWIGTATDIHESKLLREQIALLLESERAARTEAEHTSRMKDEFLATLSHELRTPLNSILGWSQVLRNDLTNLADVEQGLLTIERNARAQNQIIEDLLDMSRIISGKVRLDVQRLDLCAVVGAAVETLRPAAAAKGIRLQAVLDPGARWVGGDPNRLQQVFWNLLSNAIKFTPKGGRVQVVLERINSHLEVSVGDSGEGIAPEFLPYVFDRFRQQDASTTRQHGGLGLGLAIVKQLVELHGGSVRAESPGVGQGTTLRVALPQTVLRVESDPAQEGWGHPQAPAVPPSLSVAALNLAGVRVLVVDDEADSRALVRRLLEDRQASVRTAGTVAEALGMMFAEPPDVLVSDIGMPGEDGYSLIRQVRGLSSAQGGHIPALALTAYARAEDRMKAVLAGFHMHLAKPIEAGELLAMVASLAGRTVPPAD